MRYSEMGFSDLRDCFLLFTFYFLLFALYAVRCALFFALFTIIAYTSHWCSIRPLCERGGKPPALQARPSGPSSAPTILPRGDRC